MFKKLRKSYFFRIAAFATLLFIGLQSIFYPELTSRWFIQGLGCLWIVDAWGELIKVRIKYLKNKIKDLENRNCQIK